MTILASLALGLGWSSNSAPELSLFDIAGFELETPVRVTRLMGIEASHYTLTRTTPGATVRITIGDYTEVGEAEAHKQLRTLSGQRLTPVFDRPHFSGLPLGDGANFVYGDGSISASARQGVHIVHIILTYRKANATRPYTFTIPPAGPETALVEGATRRFIASHMQQPARTFLPIATFERRSQGWRVESDPVRATAVLRMGDRAVLVGLGSRQAKINGQFVDCENACRIANGRLELAESLLDILR